MWLGAHEFGLVELRGSPNFTLKPKLLRIIIQKSRAFLDLHCTDCGLAANAKLAANLSFKSHRWLLSLLI